MPKNGTAPVTNKDFCQHENIKDKYSSIQVCIYIYYESQIFTAIRENLNIPGD